MSSRTAPVTRAAGDRERTDPMRVDNMGFLLDRLGADCAPLQFIRELTHNAIEAIEALPERSGGTIVWDYDRKRFEQLGIYKLCLIDTGTGMSGPEMVRYINALSSSGRHQAVDKNYGVGAKIAAATRNPAGVVYLSWKDGHGSMIHLWRDPSTNEYGLRQVRLPDGGYAYWATVSNEVKPAEIGGHGTVVILLGNAEDEDTMRAPDGTMSPSRWIARYLNTRYFVFPERITVKAREGYTSESPDTNVLRTVKGAREFLEKYKEASGKIAIADAVAYWWILKATSAVGQSSGANLGGGHMAALHRNELYELVSGRSGTARLQNFGVSLGHQRVVIYVEPRENGENRLTTNTARTNLRLNEEPLPWGDWAEQFRENLPEPIRALMDSIAQEGQENDYERSIKERLREIEDLLRLKKYRPAASGTLQISTDLTLGTSPEGSGGDGKGSKRGEGKSATWHQGDLYTQFLVDAGGQPGVQAKDRFDDVQVFWVPEDEVGVADRAAKFLTDQRRLLINENFRVYTEFVERWAKTYKHAPGALSKITQVVREWYQQTLLEVIYRVDYLKNSREWTGSDLEDVLSPEALTAAVLPCYHIEMAVRRALGTKLGSMKDKSA